MQQTATTSVIATATPAIVAATATDRAYGIGTFEQFYCPICDGSNHHVERIRIETSDGHVCVSFFATQSRTPADERVYGELRDEIHTAAAIGGSYTDPAALTMRLNAQHFQLKNRYFTSQQRQRTEPFFYAALDRGTGVLCYTNAGQHAIVLRRDGAAEILDRGGPPLGMNTCVGYESGAVRLDDESDMLLLVNSASVGVVPWQGLRDAHRDHCGVTAYMLWQRMKDAWSWETWAGKIHNAATLILKPVPRETHWGATHEPEAFEYESRKCGEDTLIRCTYRLIGKEPR